MPEGNWTRRRFSALAAAIAAAQAGGLQAQPRATVSAADLAKRISDRSGVALPERSVDGFKAGDPNTAVRGIAVTAMATMEVLNAAARAGHNLVVSFEPTFFSRADGVAPPAGAPAQGAGARVLSADDPILAAKRRFIADKGLIVYRLHDQWAGRAANEHASALARAMGWTRSAAGGDAAVDYAIPAVGLAELVPQIKTRLKISGGLRVVGDPATRIERVSVLPGLQSLAQLRAKLPRTDLLLVGETRDWEGPEYVGDAAAAGLGKGLITVGKVVSADPGMRACADWLRTFIPEAPVEWIAAGDPYWRPA